MGWRTQGSGSRRFKHRLGAFWRDRSGVGAVEFALIAPLLLMIYITVFELTIGLSVSKRVSRASATIADLVSQHPDPVKKDFLETMMPVAAGIFVPYGGDDFTLNITGILVNGSTPKVVWSWSDTGTKPYGTGSTVDIPDKMKIAGAFVVHAELSVPHQLLMFMPGLIPSQMRDITIRQDYYFRSRSGDQIDCGDC